MTMAKKSSTARQNAARRTQVATRTTGAVLVRPENQNSASTATESVPAARASGVALADAPTTTQASAAPSATSRVAPQASQPVKLAPKPAATPTRATTLVAKPTPPTLPAKPTAPTRSTAQAGATSAAASAAQRGQRGMTREQANRLARARATQRTRAANLITPEHFNYVLTDLRLIVVVAVLFTIALIVLHFALPQ